MKTKFIANGRGRAAFSLVEVCLAVGIMTFSLVSILGLLPTGLEQLSGSVDRARVQGILQQIMVDARQTDFNELKGKGTYSLYFDCDGNKLERQSSNAAYTAVVTIDDRAELPGAGAAQSTLLRVTVGVKKTPGGANAEQSRSIENLVGYVACNDLSLLTQTR